MRESRESRVGKYSSVVATVESVDLYFTIDGEHTIIAEFPVHIKVNDLTDT